MGVKSTVHLSREEAERRYIDHIIDTVLRPRLVSQVSFLSDTELEDVIERFNDEKYESGGGFDNYIIDARTDVRT
jgi:hypothetical protein